MIWFGVILLMLSAKAAVSSACNCGWHNIQNYQNAPMRYIVNGTNTGPGEFPMMAGIVDVNLRDIVCGATIITEFHVLTAAHCVFGKHPQRIGIYVGGFILSNNIRTARQAKLFRTSKVNIHPGFGGTSQHDLAVVTIQGRMGFDQWTGPACLPFARANVAFNGARVDILGWGSLSFGGERSNVLQKARVNVISFEQCRSVFPNAHTSSICTFARGRDACQFDSGGPVLWLNPSTNRVVLLGVLSSGKYCGESPSLNVRVGHYMDWILSVIHGAFVCSAE